jgi:hypothetical protein
MRSRVAGVHDRWRTVLLPAFELGLDELGVDRDRYPASAVVALVTTFNQGVMLERLTGVTAGHDDLLEMIDHWLTGQETRGRRTG